MTVSATVLPPLPAGATPLGETQQGLSRTPDSWPGYRLAPGPAGEEAAVVLSPERYQSLSLAARLIEASARVNLGVCQDERLAQAARANERAREQAAEIARLRSGRAEAAWERVAWVALGVAVGTLVGGTAVWLAK
jgi:PHD/YefM family antitoxin component YafN of YafNO toxin-antitoxin module